VRGSLFYLSGRITMLISLSIFGFGLCKGQGRLPREDTQQWNDVQISAPVTKSIDFLLFTTLRLGQDITRPVDERVGAGFAFKYGKYITFTPGYLHITTQPTRLLHLYENRLSFATTVRVPVRRFTFTDRNLLERRLRHPGGNSTRYRNKLSIEHPLQLGTLKFNIFVSDEVFYDSVFKAWTRNRISAGGSKNFNKHIGGDLYYLRQNDGHSLPGDIHVLGTAIRIRL